jgi:hypothetical protein
MSKTKSKKLSKMTLENCNDDRDPISMTLFWTENNGIRTIVYPKENIKDLVFYKDTKDRIMCLEKESLIYLKTYNINSHPVTMEPFPENIFDNINIIDMNQIVEDKSLKEIALDVFQYFSNISIFIDYNWFLQLNRDKLIKFNYEVRDFWLQNFTPEQRYSVSNTTIFSKQESDLSNNTTEEIQLYLLNQMKMLLTTEKEELKYMINYILVGALGIVIPDIKELYPDFDLAFYTF